MRSVILCLLLCGAATADEVVCIGGRCLLPRNRTTVVVSSTAPVVVESSPAPVVVAPRFASPVVVSVSSAQGHAERLATTGGFYHAGSYGGGAEGIGFSTRSADDAVRRCCYWGKRQPRDIGTAWCPSRRGWVAVVRYH